MCRCCGVCQQKVWVFGLGTLFIASGLVSILWWPTWIEEMIYKELPLSACSRTFDKWAVAPIPVYMHMYLFNWTNPEQVRIAGIKPHFDKVGPYVFREEKTKEDITWYSNKTVSFKPQRTWHFEPEMSGGTLQDNVTCPHLPSIAAATSMRDSPKVLKVVFNNALNSHGGALYQTHTAIEWLFDGFFDEFLDYAKNLSAAPPIEDNHFAWFLHRNGSKEFEGKFTVHTGQGNLREMGELKYWNGINHTGFFENECGRLNGSTADLFVPRREEHEVITIFISDTCRIVNLVPSGRVVVEGIEAIKYETKPDTYDNGQLNPDMKCYCPKHLQPDNCPKSGVTDIGSCADGAPMYMSHPNFMYADPSYANTTTGMNANYEKDNYFIIMEPKLGIPLQVNANVQISLRIQKDNDITILRNIPEFYAPLFITASTAVIDRKLAKEVKFALGLPSLGRNIGIGLVVAGGLLIIIGLYLTITRKWRGQRKDSIVDQIIDKCDEPNIEQTN